MKLKYLGTAAAEGFPAVFCNCEYCKEARRLGGKNIRTRSQALINDDLLIDYPADSYSHFLSNGIEGDSIKYLLITHTHSDHFYFKGLQLRFGPYAHDMRADKLHIYTGKGVADVMKTLGNPERYNLTLNELKPFDVVEFGEYTVTALPARHAIGEGALIYVIQGDKTILYAHDTGYFYDEVFDFIKEKGFEFDLISMDCTNVDLTVSDEGTHMGVDNIERAVKRLEDIGAVTDKTKKMINHFSHNAAPLHSKLEERVAALGYGVSYDGLCVEV